MHGDLRGVRAKSSHHTTLMPIKIVQANILINDEFRIQLADFGLSQFADASSASAGSHSGGAVRWLAPEMLRGSRSTYASDIYAFGCVWLEVKIAFDLYRTRSLTTIILGIHPRAPVQRASSRLSSHCQGIRRCSTRVATCKPGFRGSDISRRVVVHQILLDL